METVLNKVRRFIDSDIFIVLMFMMALGIIILGVEIPGCIFFGFIICFIVVISPDVMSAFVPFFLLYAFAIRCKNSFDEFMGYIWCLPIFLFAVVFHIVAYRKMFTAKRGELFLPISLVSLSCILGGVGIMTPSEYFTPTNVIYMLALGVLILLIYFAFGGVIGEGKNGQKPVDERLSKVFITLTVFLFCAVVQYYISHWEQFIMDPDILPFQWRNNACTLLMIAMPFCFYMSTKKFPYIITVLLSYFTILMSGSRGGLLFGGIELLALIIYFAVVDKKHRKILLTVTGIVAVVVIIISPKLLYVMRYTIDRFFSSKENFRRLGLYERSVTDFLSNPIFGRGVGYMGNRDLHPSKQGTLCWYHSSIPQVIGSFGISGILTYGYQMFCRLRMFWKRKSLFSRTIFWSFVGLELMSIVNPGIFAPPFLVIMTVLFVFAENEPIEEK